MSAYLYPEKPSKKAYKDALKNDEVIIAAENTPWGSKQIVTGVATFEGPHYPKPHKYYGQAVIENGQVIKIS